MLGDATTAPTDQIQSGSTLPYARGRILSSTEDDYAKLQRAWRIVGRRITEQGPQSVFNFSGLERSLPLDSGDLPYCDDEITPSLYRERFKRVALQHLGGSPDIHDVVLLNRLTAATLAVHLALVAAGDMVLGVSASHSHPSVIRASKFTGARFIDTQGVGQFAESLERADRVALVVVTRLAVTYDLLPLDAIRMVVRLAHDKRVPVYLDDAGGARVGPAIFGQPRMLELGVDLGGTGLDKYGTAGPRLGLLGGESSLVARAYSRAFEFGLEARPLFYLPALRSVEGYTPQRVQALVGATKRVACALRAVLGDRVHETPTTAQLLAGDILGLAMERAGSSHSPIVPYEATAALAMLLLQEHGVLTVHFAGLPPGTPNLLFKFIPPETLERFGGPQAFALAVDSCLSELSRLLRNAEQVRALLLEYPPVHDREVSGEPEEHRQEARE